MPTFLDIGKKEKIGRTFLDIEEKRQTFLDVEPKKKERKPKEISQPLISEEKGKELKGRLFGEVKEPELIWTPVQKEMKEPIIRKPLPTEQTAGEMTYPQFEETLDYQITSILKKSYPDWMKTKRGESSIKWLTWLVIMHQASPMILGKLAQKVPAFGQWAQKAWVGGKVSRLKLAFLKSAVEGGVAGGMAKEPGAPLAPAMLQGAATWTIWNSLLGVARPIAKILPATLRKMLGGLLRKGPKAVWREIGGKVIPKGQIPALPQLPSPTPEVILPHRKPLIEMTKRDALVELEEMRVKIEDLDNRVITARTLNKSTEERYKNDPELLAERDALKARELELIPKAYPETAEKGKPEVAMQKLTSGAQEAYEHLKTVIEKNSAGRFVDSNPEFIQSAIGQELLNKGYVVNPSGTRLILSERAKPEEFVERRKVAGEEKVIKEIPKEKMIIREQVGLRRLKRYEVGRVVEDLEMSAFKIPPDDRDIKRSLENVVGTLPKEEMDVATIDVKAYMEKQSLITNGAGFIEATNIQKRQAHLQARRLHWISEKGKDKPQYRKFARLMTGKSSIKDMTYEEAQDFTEALKLLEPRGEMPAKVVTTKNLISKELADKISGFKEIGVIEEVRPAWRVFRKIGLLEEVFEPAFEAEVLSYEELMNWVKEKNRMMDAFGRGSKEDPYGAQKLFLAREQRLPKGVELTPEEGTVLAWGGRMLDKWADELNIPPEKRQNNYITHIFEAEIAKALKEKHPIPAELIRGLDFKAPSSYFNPYLKKRLGEKTGLREDFWTALDIYVRRQIKYKYFDSLIKRIRIYERFLPPNSARYLRHYIARITNRPLPIDNELQQNMKELAQTIKTLPKGERLGEIMERGNFSGYLAYEFTGLLYEAFLGLYPISAIKNLSQKGLIVAECGPISFAKAKVWKLTPEGRRILKKSIALRSRKLGFLPGIDETFLQGLNRTRRKYTLAMFKAADWDNVSDAVATGYLEAKAKGLPEDWAMKRGDEVARKTQYLYSKLASSTFAQLSGGRILGVLTTWPANWLELMMDWIKASPSDVYGKYEQLTGQRVFKETNWVKRRGSLWKYLALVLLAGYVQRKTKFKALYYTGWTSLATLARMASGELAGLGVAGGAAKVVAGATTGDMRMLKEGWNELRPDKMISVVRKLESILSGDSDWLSLFFILKKSPKYRKERAVRKLR